MPGIAVASSWRSFIQSSTVLPVIPRYSAFSSFTRGRTDVAPERVLDVEHVVEPGAHDDLRGPALDALEQVLVAPEEPGDELLLGELDGVGTGA